MGTIKLAIAGVGNCASALVQGMEFYRTHDPAETAGVLHPDLGGYRIEDIQVVCAFDIDARKVGRTLDQALLAPPNCTKIFQEKLPDYEVRVQMGPVLDGVASHMADYDEDKAFRVADAEPVPVVIAALGEQMLELTGRYADGTILWMAGLRAIEEHIVPKLRAAASEAGRPEPRVIVRFWVITVVLVLVGLATLKLR